MTIDLPALAAVLVLALTTYLTRIAGLLAVSSMKVTRRLERVLEALAGAVLISIVAPAAIDGDVAMKCAVGAALVIMVLQRNATLAMAAGVATAILVRLSA